MGQRAHAAFGSILLFTRRLPPLRVTPSSSRPLTGKAWTMAADGLALREMGGVALGSGSRRDEVLRFKSGGWAARAGVGDERVAETGDR